MEGAFPVWALSFDYNMSEYCTFITLNTSPVEHHQGVKIDQDVLPHHTKVTKLTKIPYHTVVYSNNLSIRVIMVSKCVPSCHTNSVPLLWMTAYSLKTASKGCTTAVTLTITKAGDIHDNSAYIAALLPLGCYISCYCFWACLLIGHACPVCSI